MSAAGARHLTTVVNVTAQPFDVYIGRQHGSYFASVFGNPYPLKHESLGDRQAVCAKYQIYFLARIRTDAPFRAQVFACNGLRLGCWCAPKLCHGDIVAGFLNGTLECECESGAPSFVAPNICPLRRCSACYRALPLEAADVSFIRE